jgi:glycosyltransferase involved in cell wall biosynthesis
MHRAGLDLRHNFLVCICTRNREESLIRLLASIDDNNYEELRVLIVDSTFPEDRFFAFDPKKHVSRSLNLHRVQTTRGLPSARNIAVSHIDREDLVVFLDDDVTLPRDFFFKVNEYFASSPSSDALGVRIVNQYKASEGLIKKIFVKLREKNYGKIITDLYLVKLHPENKTNSFELIKLPDLSSTIQDLVEHRKSKII